MLGKFWKNFGRHDFAQIPKKELSISFGFAKFRCMIPNVAGFRVWPQVQSLADCDSVAIRPLRLRPKDMSM